MSLTTPSPAFHRFAVLGIVSTIALAGLLVVTDARPASAATLAVTTLADDGVGSLREAIQAANTSPEADIITFAATGTITLLTDLPSIEGELTITGPSDGILLDGSSGTDLVGLAATCGSDETIVATLTVTDVDLTGFGGMDGFGIAVACTILTLDGVSVTNSTTGVIATVGGATITDSAFTDNTSFGVILGSSSASLPIVVSRVDTSNNVNLGLIAYTDAPGATATLTDIVSANNYIGVQVDSTDGGTATLAGASVTGNSYAGVNVLSSGGTIDLSGVTATGNDVGVFLEADTAGAVTITDSDVSGNASLGLDVQADGAGTSVAFNSLTANDSGGIGADVSAFDGATISIAASTFADNAYNGAYLQIEGATLAISGTTVTGNEEDGVYLNVYNGGTASITASTFSDNEVDGLTASVEDSSLAITSVSANDNESDGVIVDGYAASTLTFADISAAGNGNENLDVGINDAGSTATITRVTTVGSREDYGMELDAHDGAVLTLSDSSSSGNYDAGIAADATDGSIELSRLSLVDNGLVEPGETAAGGLHFDGDGAGSLVLRDSTVTGNLGYDGGGVVGDLTGTSTLSISNSTISGNSSVDSDDGSGVGGILIEGETGTTAALTHSTVFENTGVVAGLFVDTAATTVSHSILAGDPALDDLVVVGTTVAIDHSLVQSADAQGTADITAGAGNRFAVAARLAPLASNGGPTLTHLPLAMSPVVNAGDPTIVSAPAADQRGLARIVQTIDIGAVETQPTAITRMPNTGSSVDAALLLGTGMLLLGGLALARGVRRRRTA